MFHSFASLVLELALVKEIKKSEMTTKLGAAARRSERVEADR